MELTGDVLIGASREKVWDGLNDANILMRCIPGCEGMEATSPTERTARVAVKIGPVRARFVGHIRMEDIRPNQGCLLKFEGSGGAAGMAKGHAIVELTEEAEGTRLRYTTHASIGGKLGQVGGRMIDAASKQMADQFFKAFTDLMVNPSKAETSISPVQESDRRPTTKENSTNSLGSHSSPLSSNASTESIRVLWFALGALSTAIGVLIGSKLIN